MQILSNKTYSYKALQALMIVLLALAVMPMPGVQARASSGLSLRPDNNIRPMSIEPIVVLPKPLLASGSYTWSGTSSIPDNDPVGTCVTIPVGDSGIITDVALSNVAIDHTWIGDLRYRLYSPDGSYIALMDRPGRTTTGNGDSSNLLSGFPLSFSDSSVNDAEDMGNTLANNEVVCRDDGDCSYFPNPDQDGASIADFAAFNDGSRTIQGDWQFCAYDFANADTGQITNVTLDLTYDTVPNVTIDQAGTQADPTNTSPINFTVVFSEPVTGFATGDVTLSGSAIASIALVTEIAPNNGTTYNVAVSGMANDGTVIASIPADVAQNTSGIGNLASTSTDNQVTYEVAPGPPQVVTNGVNSNLDTGDGILSEFETATVAITELIVTFSEAMDDTTVGDEVTNVTNYLLLEEGSVVGFQTTSCTQAKSTGVDAGDTQITINSVSYDNGTFAVTLNLAGSLPNGIYRLYACGTATLRDLAGDALAGDGVNAGTDFIRNFQVQLSAGGGGGADGGAAVEPKTLPATGFPMGVMMDLPFQPANKAYTAYGDLWLEVPKLGLKMSIVGVPQTEDSWDVTWLGKDAGYLQGTAFPTWDGNTVLTAHVWDAFNNPGPFAKIKDLLYGDQVKIHAFGQVYTYEVRESRLVSPSNIRSTLKHENLDWVTLLTCEDYSVMFKNYSYRRAVRAVLISVKAEK